MTTHSSKRTLCLAIGLTLTAAFLLAANVGGTPQNPLDQKPTLDGRGFQCDPENGGYRVSFTWTRRMPGSGAWLGNVTVRQGANIVVNNKPIQVFAATPSNPAPRDPINRQFQAQDGSFYCSTFTISSDPNNLRNIVEWSGCRGGWLLADQLCRFPRIR